MILDSSAALTIPFREPDARRHADAITGAGSSCRMSVANALEAYVVAEGRGGAGAPCSAPGSAAARARGRGCGRRRGAAPARVRRGAARRIRGRLDSWGPTLDSGGQSAYSAGVAWGAERCVTVLAHAAANTLQEAGLREDIERLW